MKFPIVQTSNSASHGGDNTPVVTGGKGGFFAKITYQDTSDPTHYAFIQQTRIFDPTAYPQDLKWFDVGNFKNQKSDDGTEFSTKHGESSVVNQSNIYLWAREIMDNPNVPVGSIVWIEKGETYSDPNIQTTCVDYSFYYAAPIWAKIGDQQEYPNEGKYEWTEQYRTKDGWVEGKRSNTRDANFATEVNANLFVPNGVIVQVFHAAVTEDNHDASDYEPATVYSQEWLFEFYGEAREFRSTLSCDMAAADSIGQICESNMRPIDNGSNLSYYPSCVQNGAGFTGSTGDVIVMHTTPFPQQYATANDPTGLTCSSAWKIISIEHAGSGSGNPIKYGYICNSDPGNGEDSYGGDACLRRLVQPTDTLAHAIQNVGCVGSYICVQAICVPGKWVRLFPKCSPCAAYAVAYQKCGSDYNIVSEHHDEQYSAVKFLVDCTQPVPRGWVDVTQSICGAFPVARTPVGFPPCFIQGDHHTHSTHNIVDYGCGTAWGGCECVVTSVWGSVVCFNSTVIGLDHNHSEAVPCGQNPGPIGSETYCSTGLCSVAGGNTCGVLSPNHFKTQVLVRRS